MYAVAIGEVFDGFEFFGSFDEFDDAEAWAVANQRNESWWIVQLKPTGVE